MKRTIKLIEVINKTTVAIIDELPNKDDHIFVNKLNREYMVEAIVRNYDDDEIRVMIRPLNPNTSRVFGW